MKTQILILLALIGIVLPIQAQQDKYHWLEEVDGKEALEFAEAQSKVTYETLSAEKDYQQIFDKSLEISNSPDRIAYPTLVGEYVYNFWKDKDHIRGIWRRSPLESYKSGSPDWETLLDIDELSEKDNIKWVYKGAVGLYPSYNRFLVSLSKGGVFVLANIRGGGEYGPKWHQTAIKENRQNAFDDLYAVSEDLITKKVTSPKHLGAMGGSNGGLLVGVAFTQRPDLYNAIVCQVPLLDMQRYNKLLAGASWMAEFGNPDIPEEWDYIKKYSPYHNLKEGVDYPEVFFYTSTRDDRVHPGHARKMVAKMNDMGYKTYYYENTEGGHAGSSTNEQSAKSNALTFSYLLKKLK
jgi:prolyl oligopeptidase PreP (S9A serine peptidase family)